MSRNPTTRRIAAVMVSLAVLGTACGLKPETREALRVNRGSTGGDDFGSTDGSGSDGTGTDGTGTDGTGTDGTGTDGSGGGSGGSGGGGGSGGSGGGSGGSGSGGGGGGGSGGGGGGGGTIVGITDTEIRIGIHAPLTGASPLPQDSFKRGAELYWKTHKVFGRNVVVEVLDDTYKPSGAIKVCQEMARRDFLVVGGAGTDQIQACARDRTLRRANTPYLSAGVTENGLGDIDTYAAISLTYREQGPLVVKQARLQGYLDAKNALGESKWAVVVSNTPNFDDAQSSIEGALRGAGKTFRTFEVPKAGSDQDAVTLANNLRSYNAPVVYILGQPTFFIKVLTQLGRGYAPIWTGVGISFGLNTVVTAACGATQGAYDGRFLSPYPGLDRAPAEFKAADGNRAKDDIELTLWGLSEVLYKMLTAMNPNNLTREAFMDTVERLSIPDSTYPGVRYTPSDHFGGTKAWQLKSDCIQRVNVTVGSAPIAP